MRLTRPLKSHLISIEVSRNMYKSKKVDLILKKEQKLKASTVV